jgi:cytochrome P450
MVTPKALAEKIRVTTESYAKIKQIVNQSTTPLLMHLKNSVKEGKVKQEEIECLMAVVAYALAPLHTVFWICYNLARHSDVQTKLALEIKNTLERGPITYSKLAEMTYLSQVITETLRLFPGVALLQPRGAESDCVLGPHNIPKGSTLFIFPYLSHRNAKYFSNPDTFNPDRKGLNTTNSGADLKFFPFGFGPRICQGQFYAENLLKAATIAIVSKHKLALVDGQPEIHGEEIGFCRPSQNVNFLLQERVTEKTTIQVFLNFFILF